ncbi:alpha/beta hydrolase [Devosia sp. CAU 1758]
MMRNLRRMLTWTFAIVVLSLCLITVAFVVSPWPSVLILSLAFAGNDAASEAALEKFVPPNVVTVRNMAYGTGVEERFDINHPFNRTGALPLVLWVHGGGWIGGSKDGVANYLKILADHGYVTVAIDYSTAPGAHYPTPVRQANDAINYLLHNAIDLGIDAGGIVLAGDSAGAQIAAQLANIVSDPAYAKAVGISPALSSEQLRGVVLVSGAFDMSSVSMDGPYGWFIRTVLWSYSGVRNFIDDEQFALASVTRYVTPDFPPAFITSGNADPLEPQAVALAQRLDNLGVHVEGLFFPENHPPLQHEYQFNLDDPAGIVALDRILAFLEAVVPTSR